MYKISKNQKENHRYDNLTRNFNRTKLITYVFYNNLCIQAMITKEQLEKMVKTGKRNRSLFGQKILKRKSTFTALLISVGFNNIILV